VDNEELYITLSNSLKKYFTADDAEFFQFMPFTSAAELEQYQTDGEFSAPLLCFAIQVD
jgi:hypothetical protein